MTKKKKCPEMPLCRIDMAKVEDLQAFAEAVRALSDIDKARLEGFILHASLSKNTRETSEERLPA